MPNNWLTLLADLIPGTRARAEDVNARQDAVDAALDKLPAPGAGPFAAGTRGFGEVCVGIQGTAENHFAILSQIRNGTFLYALDTGSTANTYEAVLTPTLIAYATGQPVYLHVPAGRANTGAATLQLEALGAKYIRRQGGGILTGGELPAESIVPMVYDGTGFQIIGLGYTAPSITIPAPSLANAGQHLEVSASGTSYELDYAGVEPNLVINSEAMLDQRYEGSTLSKDFTPFATQSYHVDMFSSQGYGSALICNIKRSTSIGDSRNSILVTASTGEGAWNAVASNGEYFVPFQYRFLGTDLLELHEDGGKVTISFWFKSNIASGSKVAITIGGGGVFGTGDGKACLTRNFTYTTTGTEQLVVETFTIPPSSIIKYVGELHEAGFTIMIGGQTADPDWIFLAEDTWAAIELLVTSGITQHFLNTSDYMQIGGLQMRMGDRYIPLSKISKSWEENLAECMAYYQKTYPIGTKPGTVPSFPGSIEMYQHVTSAQIIEPIQFPVKMVDIPSVTLYAANNVGDISNLTTSFPVSVTAINYIGDMGFSYTQIGSSETAGDVLCFHYIAKKEL